MIGFKCKKCGDCCSNFLPLLEGEILLMKKIKGKENIRPLERNWYVRCPFLNMFNRCDIYEQRPFICRQFDCNKFKNREVDVKAFREHRAEDFRLVDIRKEIFGRKDY